jgi:hypothetical protein
MASVPGQQLTDMWMVNPGMFDPTGWAPTDPYSNYQNTRLPFPPTYYGTPSNAATGQPIASYQAPAQPPQGTTLNTAPQYAQLSPVQQAALAPAETGQMISKYGDLGMMAAFGAMPQPGTQQWHNFFPGGDQTAPGGNSPTSLAAYMNALSGGQGGAQGAQGGAQGAQGGGASAPANNWYAALDALRNPGKVTTPGAQMSTGGYGGFGSYQPAGGVNNAFLQSRGWGPTGGPAATPGGGGPPTNQNFMSALAAIQGRPQQF